MMPRSFFLLITAILAFLLGGMMLICPKLAAEGFGIPCNAPNQLLLQSLGAFVICGGYLNFSVRNQTDSVFLRYILVFNLLLHVLGLGIEGYASCEDILAFSQLLPGLLIHVFVAGGAAWYLWKLPISQP